MAAEVFGRLIQIHDVTHGRSLVEQRSFMDDRDMPSWTALVRSEHPPEVKLEILTEDSPHFFVREAAE